jgi:uncharacterized protein DUF3306
MAEEPKSPERFSLSRWSRRKLEAARADPAVRDVAPAPDLAPASPPAPSGSPAVATAAAPVVTPVEAARPEVDTLTFESDFGAFLTPEVDPATQRAALKKLFSDPRFNVMDGLDTYIDDYTQADPMPAGMLDKLGNVYALLKEEAPAADARSAEADEEATHVAPPAIEAAKPLADVPASAPPVSAAAAGLAKTKPE